VNKNFATLVAALNAALARIDALEAENQTLTSKVAAIEGNKALDLGDYVEILDGPEVHGYTTVRFSGVNLQVVDGTGSTYKYPGEGEENGLGNLIVGYNLAGGIDMCAVDNVDETVCEGWGAVYSNIHKTGSHNLVVGDYHNYAGTGGVVAGYKNGISSHGTSVLGGTENLASDFYGSVSGGKQNNAGWMGVVVGGYGNKVRYQYSVVVGGEANEVATDYGVVLGGTNNRVQGKHGVVLGGEGNRANQDARISPDPTTTPGPWLP